jgi:hypothetical protein
MIYSFASLRPRWKAVTAAASSSIEASSTTSRYGPNRLMPTALALTVVPLMAAPTGDEQHVQQLQQQQGGEDHRPRPDAGLEPAAFLGDRGRPEVEHHHHEHEQHHDGAGVGDHFQGAGERRAEEKKIMATEISEMIR